jgi:hypothetical protein
MSFFLAAREKGMPERLNLQLDRHQPPVAIGRCGARHFSFAFGSPTPFDGGVFLCLEV